MACPPQDLTHILAQLAPRSHCAGSGGAASSADNSLSASISSLAAALSLAAPASGGTRVLDVALSLMCFDSQEVDMARVAEAAAVAVAHMS